MNTYLNKSHPLRPPDWRYRKALLCLREGRRPSRLRSDKEVWYVYRCLARRRLACASKDAPKMNTDDPCLTLAFDIHDDRQGWLRGAIEARLLAGEPHQSIGQKTGLSKRVIAWYALAFYDVQTRLRFRDFIYGAAVCDRPLDDSRSRYWKHIAYVGGAKALDQVLHAAETRDVVKKTGDLSSGVLGLVDIELSEKMFGTVDRMDPSDQDSIREMLKLYGRMTDAGKKAEHIPPGQADYLKNVEVMMEHFPWSVGARGVPSHLREWSETAVELRAEDLLRVAAGEKLDNEAELKRMAPRDPGDRA